VEGCASGELDALNCTILACLHYEKQFAFHSIFTKNNSMVQLAGISTKQNAKGEITHVTTDVEKHKELITPLLKQLGITQKTKFQEEIESGEWHTVEEARALSLKYVDELWSK
jgi:hypothetical protein